MRKSRIVLVAAGVIVLAVAGLWRPLALPILTKLPASLHVTLDYAGTYTGYVDPATGAPLPAPQRIPATAVQVVRAVRGKSTSSDLTVSDVTTLAIGPQQQKQVLQYVLNRSTSVNVASPNAYALVPADVVNRSGSYGIGLGPNASPSRSYLLWQDQVGRGVPLRSSPAATQTIDGMAAQRWTENLKPAPMAPRYVTAMHLPAATPVTAFAAELKAKGVDLSGALTALEPALTAAQKASLATLAATPIPLHYSFATAATLLVQPTLGATVDVTSSTQTYYVQPDLAPFAAGLAPILAAHASNPVAAQLIASATSLASVPASPLYSVTIRQTPASVATQVGSVRHDLKLLDIAGIWLPVVAGLIGLLLIGLAVRGRRRAAAPQPDDAASAQHASA